MKAWEIYR
jgi:hypothetical protein